MRIYIHLFLFYDFIGPNLYRKNVCKFKIMANYFINFRRNKQL